MTAEAWELAAAFVEARLDEREAAADIGLDGPVDVLRRAAADAADRGMLASVRNLTHKQAGDRPTYGDCRSLFRPGYQGVGCCDCGVDQLRMAILGPVASVWAEHPDYPAATP